MKMNEPIGNPIWGPLLIRLSLGSYFVMAGLYKFQDLPAFINRVHEFHVLPQHMATLYGTLLPYVEIVAGFFLIFGIWTTMAAMLTSLMLFSFIYAIGFFDLRTRLFNKDVILLCASISLLYTGAGAVSVDRFRKTG